MRLLHVSLSWFRQLLQARLRAGVDKKRKHVSGHPKRDPGPMGRAVKGLSADATAVRPRFLAGRSVRLEGRERQPVLVIAKERTGAHPAAAEVRAARDLVGEPVQAVGRCRGRNSPGWTSRLSRARCGRDCFRRDRSVWAWRDSPLKKASLPALSACMFSAMTTSTERDQILERARPWHRMVDGEPLTRAAANTAVPVAQPRRSPQLLPGRAIELRARGTRPLWSGAARAPPP
jgi:hypothetical protein